MKYDLENGLSALDDKCVRVTLTDGGVLEGACQYNTAEYNEIEYGEDEEGLDVGSWLVYKSQIETVEIIEDEDAFLQTFGAIEEEAVADGFDTVEDILFSDEPRSTIRLLRCLSAKWDTLPDRERIASRLPALCRYTDNGRVRALAEELMREKSDAQ